MQSIISTIKDAIGPDASKCCDALTNKEAKLLRQQWPLMLEADPELVRKSWMASSNKSSSIKKAFGMGEYEDPKNNEAFMKLPITIQAFFQEVIVTCECDEKKYGPKCEQLGARHIDFGNRGFHSNFWDIFLNCMVEVISECPMKWSGEERSANVSLWQRLLHSITQHMRVGYEARKRSETNGKTRKDIESF